jgi:hypothetical protein
MSERIVANLKKYPLHEVSLFNGDALQGTIQVECGISTVKEMLPQGTVFENLRMERMLNKMVDLFEPEKIEIISKEK